MWSYFRGCDVVRVVFSGHVDVDQAYEAGRWLRDEVGDTVVRFVAEVKGAEFAPNLAWVLLSCVEKAPVTDVVVVGARGATRRAFADAGEALRLPVSQHDSVAMWVAEEQVGTTLRPRALARMQTQPGL